MVEKSDLIPGSVLLWAPNPLDRESSKAEARHGVIGQGQAILHRQRPEDYEGAEASTGHAAMWLKHPDDPSGPEVGEASRAAVTAQALREGTWVAFAPQNEALGQQAADIMKRWTQDQTLEYRTARSLSTFPLAMAFGNRPWEGELEPLQQRAAQDAHTSTPSFAQNGTFCSEIVANAYLSASALSNEEPVIGTVPHRTTPSALHAEMVKSTSFSEVGIIHVPPSAEQDQPPAAEDPKSAT